MADVAWHSVKIKLLKLVCYFSTYFSSMFMEALLHSKVNKVQETFGVRTFISKFEILTVPVFLLNDHCAGWGCQ